MSSLTWKPAPKTVNALDAAFYATVDNVESCGKPVLLPLDVSGSMDGSMIAGSCLSAREASAAMALVTVATEPDCEIIAFSAAANGHGGQWGGGEPGITRVAISPRMRLDSVIEKARAIPMGGTDCALPMVRARRNQLALSGFKQFGTTWKSSFPGKEKYMNTLAPLFIVLAMLIATVVLLKIGRIRHSHIVSEGYVGTLMQSLSTAQNAGNTLVLGLPGFVPLKNGKAGSSEHKAEDGAS